MMVKTSSQLLELLRKYDASRVMDTLEPWQRREIICLIRNILNSAK